MWGTVIFRLCMFLLCKASIRVFTSEITRDELAVVLRAKLLVWHAATKRMVLKQIHHPSTNIFN